MSGPRMVISSHEWKSPEWIRADHVADAERLRMDVHNGLPTDALTAVIEATEVYLAAAYELLKQRRVDEKPEPDEVPR